ncbi:MAG: YqaJ viral recombinase family protein [Holophaga sp.]|nr:YqaJ viral recombinase family protein [Holophaga sp.]
MNPTVIDQTGIQNALQSRMNQKGHLGDRTQYIGASEIGSCLRRVAFSKLYPESLDPASIGRMLAGRAMENEVVQIVRLSLNGNLRNTGRVQLDLHHPTLPFHAHPDGRIAGGFDGLEGDGVLEVKTAGAATFNRYESEGLPQNYRDQVQTQMGLAKLSWALVVLVSRECLSEMATFTLRFDPEHYAHLEERAALAASALQDSAIREQLCGEPERGYCYSCPYSADCAAYIAQREAGKRGEIPEVTRLQLECQCEELASLESNLGPMQERVTELRDQVKSALLCTGANRVVLENGIIQIVESSRTCFDSKSLQREAPDVFARFQKTSKFSTLRINDKGDRQCQSMAS